MLAMEVPEVRLWPCRRWLSGSCLLFALATTAPAAEIRVDAGCSLVDAIDAANSDAAVAGSSCEAGSGADRIILTSHVTLSLPVNYYLGWNAVRPITTDITIDGRGHYIYRSATAPFIFRFFAIRDFGTLRLENVILENGREYKGGAVYNNVAGLVVRNSVFLGNDVTDKGGAIYNRGSTEIESTLIWGNSAGFRGGGIYNADGDLSVRYGAVGGNEAELGGAVFSAGGTLILLQTDIHYNEADAGAGVYNEHYMWAWETLFHDNTASGSGGALFNTTTSSGEAYVRNSTFSANTAFDGGAIYNDGFLNATLTTFSGNASTGPAIFTVAGFSAATGSDASLSSSIVADSTGGGHCSWWEIVDEGANLGCHGDEVTHFDVNLQDNGGPTMTHALYGASNAVNAAINCGPWVDQRGVARLGGCDIGAFDFGLCEDDVLRDEEIIIGKTMNVCEHVWIGPNVEVVRGAFLSVTAGGTITLRNGFSVDRGTSVTLSAGSS
ncbi:MAG: hypothetical protein GY769_10890 [bacterium]|nr:hypothetical protein [bacterium]